MEFFEMVDITIELIGSAVLAGLFCGIIFTSFGKEDKLF